MEEHSSNENANNESASHELTGAEKAAIEFEAYKQDCFDAESVVAKASEKIADLKDQLKGLKGELTAAEGELAEAVRDLRDTVRCRKEKQHVIQFPDAMDGEDGWKTVSVSKLGITEKLIAALQDHQLRTIGDIATYTSNDGLLTDITGIGEATAEEILKALDRFWAAWNDHRNGEDE